MIWPLVVAKSPLRNPVYRLAPDLTLALLDLLLRQPIVELQLGDLRPEGAALLLVLQLKLVALLVDLPDVVGEIGELRLRFALSLGLAAATVLVPLYGDAAGERVAIRGPPPKLLFGVGEADLPARVALGEAPLGETQMMAHDLQLGAPLR